LDILKIMENPLTQSGRPGHFLRLVLAEAASYGMPTQIIATLDDIGSMLGFYDPLPAGQAAQLAGPVVQWRSDRRQPTYERISEVEALAMKQRALIAFGGAEPDHTVGTAEIVVALGNCHKDTMPEPYYEVWSWASTDVMATLSRVPKAQIRNDHGWAMIYDDVVLRPGGRLHATYTEIATSIRRTGISALKGDPDDPRTRLRPLALHFLRHHQEYLREAEAEGPQAAAFLEVDAVRRSIATIRSMFPDITTAEVNALEAEYDAMRTAKPSGF
jgi:hypothetical protein